MAGLPLYGTPQFSITYPFFFFHSGLYSDPLSALTQLHHVTLFHIAILYFNSYFLLRILRIGPLAALLGASLFAFTPNTFAYSVWINTIAAYCWLPLVTAAVVLILENRHIKSGVILGSFSFGLLILASPAQPLIHAIFVIFVLYFFNFIYCFKKREFSKLLRTSVGLAIMAVLTFAIASPVLLPAVINSKEMIRFIGDYPAVIGNAKIPFEGFLTGQLELAHLAGTLLPLQVPIPIGSSFFGLSATLLALFGIFKVRTNWIVLPLLFISLYALLSATGNHLGFARLNYQIPLINKIREPPRHLVLFVFSASILAAFGFDYLVERLSTGYKSLLDWKHLAIPAIFLGLASLALRSNLTYVGSISKPLLVSTCGMVICLLVSLRWLNGWGRQIVTTLAMLLVIYANLQFPEYVPKLQDGDYFSTANLVSHKTLASLAEMDGVRNYRIIFADNKLSSAFWSMNASYYDLRSFQAYMNPVPYRHFDEVFQRFDIQHYYPLLGARYYLCNPCDPALLRDFKFQTELNGYKLYVAENALPRFFLLNRLAGTYGSPDEFFNKIHEGYDFTTGALIETKNLNELGSWLGEQSNPPRYAIREERSSVNTLRWSINSEGRALFVLNEYYNPDWKATVNGRSAKLLKVNLNQIGIELEKGASLVEFDYHPTLFIRLLWIQWVTFWLLLLYAVCAFINRNGYFKSRIPAKWTAGYN